VLADVLLAPLAPELFLHQTSRGVPVERITATLRTLAGLLERREGGVEGG